MFPLIIIIITFKETVQSVWFLLFKTFLIENKIIIL